MRMKKLNFMAAVAFMALAAVSISSVQVSAQETEISNLWTAQSDMFDRPSECTLNRLVTLSDGSVVGMYNTGAESLIYEGRIVKLTSNGAKVWETTIQAGKNTTADRLDVAQNGNSYVLGTTLVNGATRLYVASFGSDGAEKFIKVLDIEAAKLTPVAVFAIDNDIAAIYTTQNETSYQLVMQVLNGNGEEVKSMTHNTNSSGAGLAVRMGDFVMLPYWAKEAYALNMRNCSLEMEIIPETGVKFHNGCASADAIYNVLQASEGYVVSQYKVVDGALTKTWETTTAQKFSMFNLYSFAVDGGVLLYNHKNYAQPGISLIGEDGTPIVEKATVGMGSYADLSVFSAGRNSNGEIYVLGQAPNYKVAMAKIASDLSQVTVTEVAGIDDTMGYFYTYGFQSTFTGSKFVFAGVVRPVDFNTGGYTPYFATLNPESPATALWSYEGHVGNTASVIPGVPVVDEQGNMFCYILSGSKSMLAKYDSNGNSVWKASLPAVNDYLADPILMSNGQVCVAGVNMNDGIHVCFVDQTGTIVAQKDHAVPQNIMQPSVIYAVPAGNSIVMAVAGYDMNRNYLFTPYLCALDENGNFTAKAYDSFEFNIYLRGMKAVKDGEFILFGESPNASYENIPFMLKFDDKLNVAFCSAPAVKNPSSIIDLFQAHDGTIFAAANTYTNTALLTYNPDGTLIAEYLYAPDGFYSNQVAKIISDGNGNAIAVGNAVANDYITNHGFTLCCNASAAEQWQYVTGANEWANDVALIEGNAVIVGLVKNESGSCDRITVLDSNHELDKFFDGESFVGYNQIGTCFSGDQVHVNGYSSEASEVYTGIFSCYQVTTGTSSINDVAASNNGDIVKTDYFDIAGRRIAQPENGIYIVRNTFSNGTTIATKIVK